MSSLPVKKYLLLAAATAPVGLIAAGCSGGEPSGTDFGAGACQIADAQPNSGTYKDGTYTEEGSYTSHEGKQHFTVAITVKDGLVTEVTSTPGTKQKTSLGYQKAFSEKLPAQITGCPVEAVKIHTVGGASLTSGEFNKMMDKLRDQAKA